MQLLFSSAFRSTASKIYALQDDEKGHNINQQIHHLSQEPDGRGPTEVLTLYLPSPEIAPGSPADLLLPVGKARACEVSACTEHTCHTQQQKDRAVPLESQPHGHVGHLQLPRSWPRSHLTACLRSAAGDAAPCCCSSSGELSITYFSPNWTT